MEDVHSQFSILGMWNSMTPLGKSVAAVASLRGRAELFVRSNPRLFETVQGVVRRLRRLKS